MPWGDSSVPARGVETNLDFTWDVQYRAKSNVRRPPERCTEGREAKGARSDEMAPPDVVVRIVITARV